MRDDCPYCLGTGRQKAWDESEYFCPECGGSGIGRVRHEPEKKAETKEGGADEERSRENVVLP